ncbi:hypothetical protein E8E14_006999 [Neopestalotiopsis sp. 37M]|nr:hypothetical protein E8E14_006999 [Neopestalotiopsis sp. 37M]
MLGAATIRRSNPELASELKDLAGDLALIRHVADMYFNSTHGHFPIGHLLGISPNEKAPQLLNPPGRAPVWHVKFLNEANDRVGTATELEERRRTWWGIMVLDRCVNIGGPQRSLGCDDPGPKDFLPMDDTFWDRGELTSLQPLVTTINVVDPVSPFARTCQASHLLSRVLQHIRGAGQGNDAGYGEAVQLHRTLLALGTVIDSESRALVEKTSNPIARTPLLTATGLCFSALLTLYDHYSCAETSSAEQRANSQWNEMHRIALSGLKEVSGRVTEFALAIMNIADLGGILHVSPLVSDCLYQAGANYVWYLCETGNEEYQNLQNVIRNALELVGTRWRAPREYIHILVLSQNRVLNLYGSPARLATQTIEMAIG